MALLLSGLAGIPIGHWLDRHGPRLLMTVSSCAASLLVLAWAGVNSLPTFYLIWAGIGLTLAAVLYEPTFFVVASWFVRQRGRALTVLTFLAGFASVIYLPLAGWLMQRQGWRGALCSLAVVLALGTIPWHAIVLRRRPEDLGLTPDGGRPPSSKAPPDAAVAPVISMHTVLRDAAFWWLSAAFFLSQLATAAIAVHLVTYHVDRGFEPGYAAVTTGFIGVMALPGRLIFTPLGDRLPRSHVTAGLFLMQMIALLVLLLSPRVVGV